MLHTALSRGAASSSAASMRSLPVGSTPSLSATRRRSSSAPQGASSFWLSSTSKRSRSLSTISWKVARVTRIRGFTCRSPPVHDLRQPQANAGEQVQQHHRKDLYAHERHHAREDLIEVTCGGDTPFR